MRRRCLHCEADWGTYRPATSWRREKIVKERGSFHVSVPKNCNPCVGCSQITVWVRHRWHVGWLARGLSWDQICVLACRIRLWRGHITLSGSSRSAEPRDHPRGFPGGCCPTSRHQSPVMLVPSCHSERSEESHPRLITLPQASRPGPFFQRRHPVPPFAEPSLVSLVASPVSCPCLRTEILRFAQNDRLFPLCHSCVREAGVLFPLRNAVGAVPVARMSVPFRWIPAKNCGNDRGQSVGMTEGNRRE